MPRIRLDPDERKTQLLAAAVTIAGEKGFKKATRLAIAQHCNISKGLVSHHFGNREELRGALIEHAVKVKAVNILAGAVRMGYEVDGPRDLLRLVNAEVKNNP